MAEKVEEITDEVRESIANSDRLKQRRNAIAEENDSEIVEKVNLTLKQLSIYDAMEKPLVASADT